MPYSDRYITLVRVGRIVTACAYITLTSNFNQVGNVSVTETIPEGFRPSGDSRAVMRGTDNSGATSFYLYGTADGKMVLNGTGYTSRFVGISGCWITAEPSLPPAEDAPPLQCAGHTGTPPGDGPFWVGVKSPNGKPPDYASYTVGPFGTGFNDEDGIIAHLWDVTATGVRFRLYTTRYQRWCGKTAIFGRWIAVWRR